MRGIQVREAVLGGSFMLLTGCGDTTVTAEAATTEPTGDVHAGEDPMPLASTTPAGAPSQAWFERDSRSCSTRPWLVVDPGDALE